MQFCVIGWVSRQVDGPGPPQNVPGKTSNNGPSQKRTTSVQWTAHLPPIDFTIELIHFEPPRSGHLSTPNNGH